MPYQSGGGRRNNVQMGVGRSIWVGTPSPAITERVLDGIPGCAAWLALLLSIASAVAFPRAVLFVAALLFLYSAIRFLLAGIANIRGLRLIREWETANWHDLYLENKTSDMLAWNDVHHVVIIPNYKEETEILSRSLANLARQYEAQKRITIVLAMEAAETGSVEKAKCLEEQFSSSFANFYFTVHPRGLPGEIQGKSANEAWAARWIKRKLVEERGYNIDHILVSTMDADTQWHPQYFYAMTYHFATHPKRYLCQWQAPIRYHGNIWEINPLMRLVNAYATAIELAYLAAWWWLPMPMSSYTLSMRLLDTSGYWDTDVIAEDWHMYIKAYFARNGEVDLEPVFLPFLAYATTGENIWETIKNRYQQTLRHAWGSKEVGYMIAKMLEHPEIPLGSTMRLLFRIAHDILLAGAGWIIMTVGSQLPILIHPQLRESLLEEGFNNPTFAILQISFIIVSVLGIVFWYQDVIVRPPRKHPITWKERALTLLSFPILPLLTLVFVAIPTLQAQTRLLVGVPLQYRVARKI